MGIEEENRAEPRRRGAMSNDTSTRNEELTESELQAVAGGKTVVLNCSPDAPPPFHPSPPYGYPTPIVDGDPERSSGPVFRNGEWHF
jgi:hypothetical protein